LQQMRTEGVDVTFDAYPYTRGCTLVAMAILPPELVNLPVPEAERTLRDPAARAELRRDWFPLVNERPSLGPDWPAMILLGHVPHPRGRGGAGWGRRHRLHPRSARRVPPRGERDDGGALPTGHPRSRGDLRRPRPPGRLGWDLHRFAPAPAGEGKFRPLPQR